MIGYVTAILGRKPGLNTLFLYTIMVMLRETPNLVLMLASHQDG